MARLKRPGLPAGPLLDLNAALHDLHQRAGMPSLRELSSKVGREVASRSRIHDAFTSTRLPAWGLLQVLVHALTETVPDSDVGQEEKRLHALWLTASGAAQDEARPQPRVEQARLSGSVPAILAMRLQWVRPAALEVGVRRSLRQYVASALQDTGYEDALLYRHDGSAGSTVALVPARERPSLTAATFLAAVDFEHQHRSHGAELRFMAHLAVRQAGHSELDVARVVADLEAFCSSPIVEPHWPKAPDVPAYSHREHPVSALVQGIDIRRSTDFWGGWAPVQLILSPSSGAIEFWSREHSETPF